jgi:hypothetical protein
VCVAVAVVVVFCFCIKENEQKKSWMSRRIAWKPFDGFDLRGAHASLDEILAIVHVMVTNPYVDGNDKPNVFPKTNVWLQTKGVAREL